MSSLFLLSVSWEKDAQILLIIRRSNIPHSAPHQQRERPKRQLLSHSSLLPPFIASSPPPLVAKNMENELQHIQSLADAAREALYLASLQGIPSTQETILREEIRRGELWWQEAEDALQIGDSQQASRLLQQAQNAFQKVQEQGRRLGLDAVVAAIEREKATSSTASAAPTSGVLFVSGSKVNIRRGPGTAYPILTQVRRGEKLLVLEKKEMWYQVETPSGVHGWIFHQLVTTAFP